MRTQPCEHIYREYLCIPRGESGGSNHCFISDYNTMAFGHLWEQTAQHCHCLINRRFLHYYLHGVSDCLAECLLLQACPTIWNLPVHRTCTDRVTPLDEYSQCQRLVTVVRGFSKINTEQQKQRRKSLEPSGIFAQKQHQPR